MFCPWNLTLFESKTANFELELICVPDFIEDFHEWIIDHECDGHIQAHTTHPGQSSFVESGEKNHAND